ncbi:MAG TPA: 4-(cytidine 5'-diphospho)-2-C-methyl-D-erythritol kinase [bacterium]|nr:4-(cytidine 5'-diphospho)-2-C-methyl-D-erythritol kinase [bacterium]HPN30552.1 4-(cytidine 5'-diphospho)-2-C-methyl-D-erythritol kinase [bacterium]
MFDDRFLNIKNSNEITVKCPAKLNLVLQITGKRRDGYHLLNTLMQSIDLYDYVTVKKLKTENSKITILSNYSKEIKNNITEKFSAPADPKKNICGKIARKLLDKFKIKTDVKITVKKNIPIGAGLGGGSSDGAGTAKAINELFNLKLSENEIIDVVKDIGADIPFNITPGTAAAAGIGEKLTRLESGLFRRFRFIIIYPGIHSSTVSVYKNYKLNLTKKRDYVKMLLKCVQKGVILNEIEKYLINDLEKPAFRLYKKLEKVKTCIKNICEKNVFMSGSGSTLFLMFDEHTNMENCYRLLKSRFQKCLIKKSVSL